MTIRFSVCLLALAAGCGHEAGPSRVGLDADSGTFTDATSSADLDEETVALDAARGDLAAEVLAPSPAVELLEPASGAVVENPVTFRITARGVAQVGLDADGYVVAEPWDPALSMQATYTFTGTGYPRTVTLSGYDPTGAIVATDGIVITIAAASPADDAVVVAATYFYQYANLHQPGSTCGVTTAAMLVNTFHPCAVTPDALYETYGLAQGQSPAALADLYRAEGLHADATTAGTRGWMQWRLTADRERFVK